MTQCRQPRRRVAAVADAHGVGEHEPVFLGGGFVVEEAAGDVDRDGGGIHAA
jgi:hypothetical protein